MAGKSYGNAHGRDNAFGLAIIGGPIIDFIEFGDLGVDSTTFTTADGREHAAGEETASDVQARRYPVDPAQNAYMQAWLADVLVAGPTAKRAANLYKYGPGQSIAESHFIPEIFPKTFKTSAGNRGTPGAASETWGLSVYGARKTL